MAVRFLYDNLYVNDATLTASSELPSMPVTASQQQDRSYRWRSSESTGEQYIDIDLGSVQAVDAVALANVRTLPGGAVQLIERGDTSTPSTGNLVATLPTENTDRRTAIQFFAAQSHRNWRLLWTRGASTEADYAELGYGFLGEYFEPTQNVRWPSVSADEIDPSVVRFSVDRQRSVVRRTRYTVGRFTWQYLSESDRDAIREMWGALGVATPMFSVLSTGLAWTGWMMYMEAGLSQSFGAKPGTLDVGFGWEEAV